MTEQWLLLRNALRQLLAVIESEPGPVKWLLALCHGILDWLVR